MRVLDWWLLVGGRSRGVQDVVRNERRPEHDGAAGCGAGARGDVILPCWLLRTVLASSMPRQRRPEGWLCVEDAVRDERNPQHSAAP